MWREGSFFSFFFFLHLWVSAVQGGLDVDDAVAGEREHRKQQRERRDAVRRQVPAGPGAVSGKNPRGGTMHQHTN